MSAFSDGVHVSVDDLIGLRLRAGGINLESRRRAVAATVGLHQSRFRGRGIDYQESRNYQPGDDIRNMDWRVTARTGRPHTKLYQEERERPVIVMLDFSPSMFFGTRSAFKSVIAVRAAGLIGWAAVNRGDRIGAFMFTAETHHEIPPAGGRRGMMRLIRDVVLWAEPERCNRSAGQGSLGAALRRLRRVARPGSLVFIISDFYSLDEDTDNHLSRLRQHNDVVACQIWDALEQEPPPPGRYGLTDGRRAGVLDTGSDGLRRRYQDFFVEHHAQVRNLLRKRSVPLLRLATHEDVAETLRRGLNAARVPGGRSAL